MQQGNRSAWWGMPDLSSNSRRLLLELARVAIKTALDPQNEIEKKRLELLRKTLGEDAEARGGCFVTLRRDKHLRGCIGTFDRRPPVSENIVRMAPLSATEDPRFPPLTLSELEKIKIEISVLGGLEKIRRLEDIEIGRHGVMVKLGPRSGTFLPEVAVEQDWTREEFVSFCAIEKAGLQPEECSRAEVYRFETWKIAE